MCRIVGHISRWDIFSKNCVEFTERKSYLEIGPTIGKFFGLGMDFLGLFEEHGLEPGGLITGAIGLDADAGDSFGGFHGVLEVRASGSSAHFQMGIL